MNSRERAYHIKSPFKIRVERTIIAPAQASNGKKSRLGFYKLVNSYEKGRSEISHIRQSHLYSVIFSFYLYIPFHCFWNKISRIIFFRDAFYNPKKDVQNHMFSNLSSSTLERYRMSLLKRGRKMLRNFTSITLKTNDSNMSEFSHFQRALSRFAV